MQIQYCARQKDRESPLLFLVQPLASQVVQQETSLGRLQRITQQSQGLFRKVQD